MSSSQPPEQESIRPRYHQRRIPQTQERINLIEACEHGLESSQITLIRQESSLLATRSNHRIRKRNHRLHAIHSGIPCLSQRKEREELLVHVTHEMRQILVDWLVDVHLSFELREQTLHLALAYLN